MKYLLISLTALLIVAPARASQFVPPDDSLKLSAEIVGRKFCAGSEGVDFLHLRLRLRYMNGGREKIILYKGSNLFFQVVVSQGGDAPRGVSRYELKTTSASFMTRESEKVDTRAPTKDFVTLRPGGIYESEVSVSLPVARAGAARGVGAIGEGEHVLRLVVSTWYESKALGERLRERWRRVGKLWTDAVVTTPVKFDSRGEGAARVCK